MDRLDRKILGQTTHGANIHEGDLLMSTSDEAFGFAYLASESFGVAIVTPFNKMNEPEQKFVQFPLSEFIESDEPLIFGYETEGFSELEIGLYSVMKISARLKINDDLDAVIKGLIGINDEDTEDPDACPPCLCGGKTVKTEIGFVCEDSFREYNGDLRRYLQELKN